MEPQQTQPPAPAASPTKPRRKKVFLGLLVLVLAVLAAVIYIVARPTHEASSPSVRRPASQVAPIKVMIGPSGFSPANIVVGAGETVSWTNQDKSKHQIVIDTYVGKDNFTNFGSGPVLKKGNIYGLAFDKVGIYNYHDKLQPKFKGLIVVK